MSKSEQVGSQRRVGRVGRVDGLAKLYIHIRACVKVRIDLPHLPYLPYLPYPRLILFAQMPKKQYLCKRKRYCINTIQLTTNKQQLNKINCLCKPRAGRRHNRHIYLTALAIISRSKKKSGKQFLIGNGLCSR